MFNYIDHVRANPNFYRQLSINEQLVTEYNCPLETPKETIWTSQGYFVYVIDGKKIWHTPGKAFELTPGKCIFVRQGAHIVEQFFDAPFCFVVFFVSDAFITETLRSVPAPSPVDPSAPSMSPIEYIDADDALHGFFNSVVPYFLNTANVNKNLLELKFRELILNVVHNPANESVTHYFYSFLNDDRSACIRKILEENFYYNFRMEEYARMCGKSLSSFKRDFESFFKTTPGKWLLQRRLRHAQLLLHTSDKSVSEIAFSCGFENVSHFSRSFKQQFGHAPAHYRQATT